jgi:hypothetical protein
LSEYSRNLRHSFVSLLLVEGANVVEVARQTGHYGCCRGPSGLKRFVRQLT